MKRKYHPLKHHFMSRATTPFHTYWYCGVMIAYTILDPLHVNNCLRCFKPGAWRAEWELAIPEILDRGFICRDCSWLPFLPIPLPILDTQS